MARVDGWYHVFHRGIERRQVYGDDRGRGHFVDLLAKMHQRLRHAMAIGSERFVRKVKALEKGGGREVEGKRELRRRVKFEEVVSAIEGMRGEAWSEMVNLASMLTVET